MRVLLLFLFLLSTLNVRSQSCFPVGTYYEGTFFSYTSGMGVWHQTFGVDTIVNGLVCQKASYFHKENPPKNFESYKTHVYYTDGSYLLLLDPQTNQLEPIYPWHPSPGDTLLQPTEWMYFNNEFENWVLDTFHVDVFSKSEFAYRIVVECSSDNDVFYDTVTVIPRIGTFPFFGKDVPFFRIPSCSLFDGRFYTLECALIPDFGLYGDSLLCGHLINSIEVPKSVEITILPNPVSGVLQVGGIGADRHIQKYQIVSPTGQVCQEDNYWPYNNQITLYTLPAGCYHILLWGDRGLPAWYGKFVRL